MRIGFDFDNTIVSYDALFHKVAREQGIIPDHLPVNKLAVRDYLRQANQEDIWTEMQGYVYGARMIEALAYPDAVQVMQRLKDAGHTLTIVSHKTKHPYLGKQYDLHAAARSWIDRHLCLSGISIVDNANIYFELTKEDKFARIGKTGCDVFIDDLPEILMAAQFPAAARRYLFDPDQHHKQADLPNIHVVPSWLQFESHIL